MKFTTAWAETSAQNVTLKGVIVALTLLAIGLGATSMKLALRQPLLIERACFSRVAQTGSTRRTDEEIEVFVKEAIHLRFDSGAAATAGYLSVEEEASRKQDEINLRTNNMNQRVIVNAIKIDKESVLVDADRLISVGTIRSAFPFPIQVNLGSASRTEGNPYGLVAVKFSPVKKEEGGSQ